MVYTAATATAAELHHFGSVLRGRAARRAARRRAARSPAQIAAKSPTVIRAAKESLNGIDPVDVKRSYRFEQGFTFELNLSGVADEHRDAFVDKRDTDTRASERDARQAHDRGRGRRRAARRHDDRHRRLGLAAQADGARPRDRCARRCKDLTVVSLRRPRRRPALRRRQGAARSSTRSCRSTRSRSSRTSAPPARPARSRRSSSTRACSCSGLQAAAWRVPFLPTRVGLGSDVVDAPTRDHARSRRPTTTARSWSPCRRCTSTSRSSTCNRGDARGNGQYLGRRPVLRRPVLHGRADERFMSVERIVADRRARSSEGPVQTLQDQPADDRRRGRGAVRRALHRVRARLRPRRGVPEGVRARPPTTPEAWAAFSAKYLDCGDHAEYRKVVGL